MVAVIVRVVEAAVAVLAGIATTARFGDSNTAKLVAVSIVGAAALLIEIGLKQAPTRSRWIRKRLDPRGLFEGAWIQTVTQVAQNTGPESSTFAVLIVNYSAEKYTVHGAAYDAAGNVRSTWKSTKHGVHFSEGDRSMSYEWEGKALLDTTRLDRKGFAWVQLVSDDGGEGQADHIAIDAPVIFNVRRVSRKDVEGWKPGATPYLVKDPDDRDSFALHYASHSSGALSARSQIPRAGGALPGY